jgi:hypothetical protein
MSKRRSIGDVVYKGVEGKGVSARLQILDGVSTNCMIIECEDPECRAWEKVAVIDDKGNHKATLFYVSECEMRDRP